MRMVLRVLSLVALILSAAWYYFYPGYEPALTGLAFLFGLISTFGHNKGQNQTVGNNSAAIQASRDVSILIGSNREKRSEEPDSHRAMICFDPEQSEVSQSGGDSLVMSVFIVVKNGLDVEVKLSALKLRIEAGKKSLDCRFIDFQPCMSLEIIREVMNIAVPARDAVKGWAHFQYRGEIPVPEFKRFVFTGNAIGEPEHQYEFEPLDWDAVIKGSSLVRLVSP